MYQNPSMPFTSNPNPLVSNQCIIWNFLKLQTCSQGVDHPTMQISAFLPPWDIREREFLPCPPSGRVCDASDKAAGC